MNSEPLLMRAGRWVTYLAPLVPVIIGIGFFFPFVSVRSVYFRVLVEVGIGLLFWTLLSRAHDLRAKQDVFLKSLILYSLVNILSASFSPARMHSLFGDYERMGGAWAILHYLLFYVVLRAFFDRKHWIVFFRVAAGVSVLVAAYAIIQWLGNHGIAPASSTIGNSGLLGGYLFITTGVCALLACFESGRWKRAAYLAMGAVNLTGMFISQNRSSLVALFAALIAGALMFASTEIRYRKRVIIGGAIMGSLLMLVLLFARLSGPAAQVLPQVVLRTAQTGVNGVDAARMLQWRAATHAVQLRPVLGFGPENYHLAWSAGFDPAMYGILLDQRWDRAHNAALEALATMGIVGLVAFLLLWAAVFRGLILAARNSALAPAALSVLTATMTGYLVWLMFWFFDLNSTMLWIALAAFLFTCVQGGPMVQVGERVRMTLRRRILAGLGGTLLMSSLWLHGYETLRVARLLHRTQMNFMNVPQTMQDFFAVFDSPVPLTTHTYLLYGRYLGWLAPRYPVFRSDPANDGLMDKAFTRGLIEFERERQRDPLNELVNIHQARLGLLASSYYQRKTYFDYAVRSLKTAIAINPRKIQPRLVLVYAYLINKEFDAARAEIASAKKIYSRSGQVYYYEAELYNMQGNIPAAYAAVDTSLSLSHIGPPSLYTEILAGMETEGRFSAAAELVEKYVVARASIVRGSPDREIARGQSSAEEEYAMLGRLPILWARASDREKVVSAVRRYLTAYPAGAEVAAQFMRDYNAGDLSKWKERKSLYPLTR